MKKLTADDIVVIRTSTAQCHVLAKRFNVHRFTILNIRQGKTWTQVEPQVGEPWDQSHRPAERA